MEDSTPSAVSDAAELNGLQLETTPPWNEVEPEQWDAFDHVCVLGIESFQNRPVLEEGPALPRGHPTRSNVLFPYLKHRTPKLHQLVFVTAYFSGLFARSNKTQRSGENSSSFPNPDADSWPVGKRSPFLLCDDPGLGKSTMAMMVMAYRQWILDAQSEGIPIPLNSRAVLSALFNLDTSSFSLEYNQTQLVERKPVLYITPHATKDQVGYEVDLMLPRDVFSPHPFAEFRKPFGRDTFYRQVEEFGSGRSDACPIVIMS